jgi:hypothetical protein
MAQGITDNLEAFAKRIETRIRTGMKGSDSMERLICRILTSKTANAAIMAQKWVEWRYGKAKETIHHSGTVVHEHVDLSKLSDDQLEQIEKIVESANAL